MVYHMAVPDDSIWEFPGMYSLTMQPYGHRNDFFFCHYLGFLLIILLEFKETEQTRLAFATFTTILVASLLLLITRGQYSIDIFCGLLFAHYFWIQCKRISWILDFEWFRSPFHLRHPAFQSKCSKCMDPINEWAIIGSEQSIAYEMEMRQKHKGMWAEQYLEEESNMI
jgi:hypothetical protein